MIATYLGDSVYAYDDGEFLILTTDNGFGPTNKIYLEAEVIDAMLRFLEQKRALKITVTLAEPDDGNS
jgi:hypothetical protein